MASNNDNVGVEDVPDAIQGGVSIAETALFLSALGLLIKIVIDALEAAPVLDFNSRIDDVIETVFAPVGWIADVVLN